MIDREMIDSDVYNAWARLYARGYVMTEPNNGIVEFVREEKRRDKIEEEIKNMELKNLLIKDKQEMTAYQEYTKNDLPPRTYYTKPRERNVQFFLPDLTTAIKKVIFNNPATIVYWRDGSKTVVKAIDEPFDKEKGLAMAISKKVLGDKGAYFKVFNKWCE